MAAGHPAGRAGGAGHRLVRARQRRRHHGISTEIAAIATFGLGALAATPEVLPDAQRYLLVAAAAAVIMALPAVKRPLHGFVAEVKREDVYATVKFVLLALVVLPVLPDEAYGPLSVLNPFKIGLMIVLVAGISFAGYVAARVLGADKGLLAAGLLGGLVSSTAVTLTYSGRAKKEPTLASYCAIAIVAASSVMFARVLVVVAVVDRPLLASVAAPLVVMAAVGLLGACRSIETFSSPSPSPCPCPPETRVPPEPESRHPECSRLWSGETEVWRRASACCASGARSGRQGSV